MPAGIEIINDYGTILIDSNAPTLCLKQKVSATSDGSSLVSYTFNGVSFPTLAINSAQWVALVSVALSGGNVTYTLRTQSTAQAVTLYLFDRVAALGSSFGLQVFDAAGNLTFDALGKPGRVVDVKDGDGTWTGVGGKTYAAIISVANYRYSFENANYYQPGDPFPSVDVQYWDRYDSRSGVHMSGSNVILGTYVISVIVNQPAYLQSPSLPSAINTGGERIVILDVTGY